MWTLLLIFSYLLAQRCSGIYLIAIPNDQGREQSDLSVERRAEDFKQYPPIRNSPVQPNTWKDRRQAESQNKFENERDRTIKDKIQTLLNQTVQDTQKKMKSIEDLKNKFKDTAPYKIGFILNMIKKNRDILSELFNVSVKHREEWVVLEQLKIFELIVHTNVDTTDLVRQLVEIHIQHTTNKSSTDKKMVVLL